MHSIIGTHLWARQIHTQTVSILYAASQAYQNRAQTRGQGRVRSTSQSRNRPIQNQTQAQTLNKTTHRIRPSSLPTRQRSMTMTTNATNNKDDAKLSGVEVEVKLRIPDAASFAVLTQALIPCFHQAHEQENLFFDGAKKELSSKRVVLRLRFYNGNKKAVLTCKGRQVLQDGVGIAAEEEEELDPVIARSFITNPSALVAYEQSPLMTKLKEQFGLDKGLIGLGGFSNLRQEYKWKGHLLEVDETSYPWGTIHEIECETDKPEMLKKELESFLKQHGVPYSYSSKSKFANFIDKTLE